MVAKKKKNQKLSKKDIEKGKSIAAISYLWIISIFILFTEKKNEFIKFHAKQATVIFLLSLIPVIGGIMWLVALYGLIMAYEGKQQKIPLVYDISIWFADLIGIK